MRCREGHGPMVTRHVAQGLPDTFRDAGLIDRLSWKFNQTRQEYGSAK